MLRTFILAALLLTAQAVTAYDFTAVANKHILPGYKSLSRSTTRLKQAASSYCRQPDQADMAPLRQAFITAFIAWQGVQHIRLGPVQYLSREHRLELWPDKRGSVGKHLSRLLADPIIKEGKTFDLSKKSAAVQGFSALERLLYGKRSPDTNQCWVINAITINLEKMSQELLYDWTEGKAPYLAELTQTGKPNSIYTSDEELAAELLNNLHTQLEFILNQKLGRPLGDSLEKARGKRAQGWRSSTSLMAIRKNLSACHQLYLLAFAPQLKEVALASRIDTAFRKVMKSAEQLSTPLHLSVSRKADRTGVIKLRDRLLILQRLVADEMAKSLHLSLGFNSLDGD